MLRKLTTAILALFLTAWASFVAAPIALAQSNIIGGGVLGDVKVTGGGGGFVGVGDTFSTGILAYYSCAEAYSAAYAAGNGNACDLVDSAAPTVVICTLKFLTTGKVDLSSASCTGGVTPATKCAAATGGVCNISQAYEQSAANANPAVQTIAANQTTLTFNSTPTGTLPAINCGTAASNVNLQSSNVTQAQPFTMSAVVIRKSDFTTIGGAFGGSVASGIRGISSFNTANNIEVHFGNDVSAAATDNAWHSISGLANGASGAINVDGSDTSSLNLGINAFSAQPFRICRGAGVEYPGQVAEAIAWSGATTAANRNAVSANQHSAGRYNF